MPIVTSQILKTVDFIKAQKFRYLENKTLILLKKKRSLNYTSRATLQQKWFCSGSNLEPNASF